MSINSHLKKLCATTKQKEEGNRCKEILINLYPSNSPEQISRDILKLCIISSHLTRVFKKERTFSCDFTTLDLQRNCIEFEWENVLVIAQIVKVILHKKEMIKITK